MNFRKFLDQFLLELLVLVGLAFLYMLLRFIIFRRKITYKEFEACFFVLVGVLIVGLFFYSR
jgi:hypothetical protein